MTPSERALRLETEMMINQLRQRAALSGEYLQDMFNLEFGSRAVSLHATDRAAGFRPMSGTTVTERTTKTWPSGAFPRNAMR